jgi:uncharacterized membrane protein YeaQ/YmgE (transglycosylase-associated protein family)
MLGAVILGLVAGYLARILTPGPGPSGCFPTLAIGLVGSLLGYFLFTEALGIGDAEVLDLGGLPGAVLGTIFVLVVLQAIGRGRA